MLNGDDSYILPDKFSYSQVTVNSKALVDNKSKISKVQIPQIRHSTQQSEEHKIPEWARMQRSILSCMYMQYMLLK